MSETEKQPLTTKKNFLCGVCEGFYGKPWTLEQRQELFNRMQRFGMSTYLYAPKDDYKHRLCWRELYCQEETDELRMLIESAKQHNINFVYALSPGLDIIYSNPEDVNVLKMKLDQVKNLGCFHFALLFDDIEDELSSEDSSNFLSIAHAQCSLTNDMYEYLGEPELFLFCPTEYCTSRTVPDMAKSLYLQTIGNKLAANIDFLWTGPRVVSRHITVEGIKEVMDIVKRPVTIWDNLHANDYDQTRLYLGPYDGRPTELVEHLRGVLTNPNCEFEANFVAMHTLAQWSKNSCTRFPAQANHDDLDMETEDEEEVPENEEDEEDVGDEEDAGEKPPSLYCPKKALVMAVTDWLPELYKTKRSSGSAKMQQSRELDGNHGEDDAKTKKSDKNSHSPESRKRFDPLMVMDMILLCDLFYLPYEHGPQAIQLLQSARWLISNFGLLVDQPGKRFMSRGRIEWYDKAIHFHDCYTNLSIVVDRFVNIPNRELLYELYSYVNDMRSNLALVNSYIKWHGIDKPEKEPFKSGEQEPWVHRGGLLAEFRRLLPIERNNDGLGGKLIDPLANHSYIIRQYFPADKDDVYDVCMKTFDDRMDASDILCAFPRLAGDYLVGFLLEHHTKHCFVVEDESGVCGYAAVAPSARDYYRSMAEDWMPELRKKYPQPEAKESEATTDGVTRQLTLEVVLKQINGVLPVVGDDILIKYPVFIQMAIMPGRVSGSDGRSVCKNLMRAVTKALTGGGPAGSAPPVHTVIPIDNHAELEFYYGCGFIDVTDSCPNLDVSWIVLALAVSA